MNVKTGTKEKFVVLTPEVTLLSANMTAEIEKLGESADLNISHRVIDLSIVEQIEPAAAHALADLQQRFYEQDKSFVVCAMQPTVEAVFEKEELLAVMNVTPTESEAGDIVQMEEIERELMNDFDKNEP